jgi:hypothetical protein
MENIQQPSSSHERSREQKSANWTDPDFWMPLSEVVDVPKMRSVIKRPANSSPHACFESVSPFYPLYIHHVISIIYPLDTHQTRNWGLRYSMNSPLYNIIYIIYKYVCIPILLVIHLYHQKKPMMDGFLSWLTIHNLTIICPLN